MDGAQPVLWSNAMRRVAVGVSVVLMLVSASARGTLVTQAGECGTDSLRVPILVYHKIAPHRPGESATQLELNVSPDAFASQMSYLHARGIAVVPLSRLVAALEGQDRITGAAVVITFDDGLVSQYQHAFPVLRQYGYPATFFVYTNPIGRNEKWLTWEQLAEMSKAGMTIGSHTRTHPWITKLTDAQELRNEIAGSRELLERKLGVPVSYFAYPFGIHTPEVIAVVQAAGYRAARAYPGGTVNRSCDLWTLQSIAVTDDMRRFRGLVDPKNTTGMGVTRHQ
jgi:peptidoglycan/xylan/chitin deacetylase (PgdA/CDA1 family)